MDNKTTETETVVLQEFKIPDANLHNLKERITKLSRRAEKLVGQPITLTVVKTFDVERTKNNLGTGVFDRFHTVTVSGPRPKLNGWVFSAALDVVYIEGEAITLVRNAPGETIPHELRERTSGCDHCHTNRNRKTLYVLRKDGANEPR